METCSSEVKVKVKVKFILEQATKGFNVGARWDWLVNASSRPLYPSYRRLGGPQGRSGRVRKIPPPTGFDLRTVQPVESHYID